MRIKGRFLSVMSYFSGRAASKSLVFNPFILKDGSCMDFSPRMMIFDEAQS